MVMLIRKTLSAAAFLILVVSGTALLQAGNASAATFVMVDSQNVAIQGYDSVAFFTESKAVKGNKEYSTQWNGATWLFASAANRDLFVASPEKYAPQYGGWCAYGAANGYAAETDPVNAWTIVDGKLYLNWDADIKKKWEAELQARLTKSENNWPGIKNGLENCNLPEFYYKDEGQKKLLSCQ